MKRVHYGLIGMMGVLVGALLVLMAVYPPAQETVAAGARFASAFETDAGGFGLPGRMIGISLPGRPLTAASLSDDFADIGYDLDQIGSGRADVPRLFLANLPMDLETLSQEESRKVVFLKIVLPLVLYANEEILADRERLWRIRYEFRQGLEPSSLDRLWLIVKAEEYGVAADDVGELARRMDIVPPSLALAQAAIASSWGMSAPVRQRNALFGQPDNGAAGKSGNMTFGEPKNATSRGESVNSSALTVGMTREASNSTYDTLLNSVRAYVRRVNVDPAYEPLRRSRAKMRSDGAPVDGPLLASQLKPGAGRDGGGVASLQAIIEAHGLRRLDDARLRDPTGAREPDA